jgi:hypothetical protein
MDPEEYVSFVVRIWRNQSSSEQPGRWCGEIEHIQSGVRWRFCTLTELLNFLQQAASISDTTMKPSADQPCTG